MRILAIVGSPHRKIGNTYQIVKRLLKEAAKKGFETEIVNLSDLKINYCMGCASCLRKGECIQKDDIKDLHEKMLHSDGIILGSPVYFLNVSSQMKTFIDRSFHMGHRPCLQGKYGASVSVYSGIGDVEWVARYMNNVLRGMGAYTVGSVTALATKPGDLKREAFEDAEKLGRELIGAIVEKKEFRDIDRTAMKDLILNNKDLFKADYKYWKDKDWIE
ncbi:MAG: flavodoxin family protein [Halobacteriota archaeon]|nr:flavodoxin family protein [Halobacteriota archaeon]